MRKARQPTNPMQLDRAAQLHGVAGPPLPIVLDDDNVRPTLATDGSIGGQANAYTPSAVPGSSPRPRGRPPKNTQAPAKMEASPSLPPNVPINSANSENAQAPAKMEALPSQPANNDGSSDSFASANGSSSSVGSTQTKRPRGRPKKRVDMQIDSQPTTDGRRSISLAVIPPSNVVPIANTPIEKTRNRSESTARRGPGRPKKTPVNPVHDPSAPSQTERIVARLTKRPAVTEPALPPSPPNNGHSELPADFREQMKPPTVAGEAPFDEFFEGVRLRDHSWSREGDKCIKDSPEDEEPKPKKSRNAMKTESEQRKTGGVGHPLEFTTSPPAQEHKAKRGPGRPRKESYTEGWSKASACVLTAPSLPSIRTTMNSGGNGSFQNAAESPDDTKEAVTPAPTGEAASPAVDNSEEEMIDVDDEPPVLIREDPITKKPKKITTTARSRPFTQNPKKEEKASNAPPSLDDEPLPESMPTAPPAVSLSASPVSAPPVAAPPVTAPLRHVPAILNRKRSSTGLLKFAAPPAPKPEAPPPMKADEPPKMTIGFGPLPERSLFDAAEAEKRKEKKRESDKYSDATAGEIKKDVDKPKNVPAETKAKDSAKCTDDTTAEDNKDSNDDAIYVQKRVGGRFASGFTKEPPTIEPANPKERRSISFPAPPRVRAPMEEDDNRSERAAKKPKRSSSARRPARTDEEVESKRSRTKKETETATPNGEANMLKISIQNRVGGRFARGYLKPFPYGPKPSDAGKDGDEGASAPKKELPKNIGCQLVPRFAPVPASAEFLKSIGGPFAPRTLAAAPPLEATTEEPEMRRPRPNILAKPLPAKRALFLEHRTEANPTFEDTMARSRVSGYIAQPSFDEDEYGYTPAEETPGCSDSWKRTKEERKQAAIFKKARDASSRMDPESSRRARAVINADEERMALARTNASAVVAREEEAARKAKKAELKRAADFLMATEARRAREDAATLKKREQEKEKEKELKARRARKAAAILKAKQEELKAIEAERARKEQQEEKTKEEELKAKEARRIRNAAAILKKADEAKAKEEERKKQEDTAKEEKRKMEEDIKKALEILRSHPDRFTVIVKGEEEGEEAARAKAEEIKKEREAKKTEETKKAIASLSLIEQEKSEQPRSTKRMGLAVARADEAPLNTEKKRPAGFPKLFESTSKENAKKRLLEESWSMEDDEVEEKAEEDEEEEEEEAPRRSTRTRRTTAKMNAIEKKRKQRAEPEAVVAQVNEGPVLRKKRTTRRDARSPAKSPSPRGGNPKNAVKLASKQSSSPDISAYWWQRGPQGVVLYVPDPEHPKGWREASPIPGLIYGGGSRSKKVTPEEPKKYGRGVKRVPSSKKKEEPVVVRKRARNRLRAPEPSTTEWEGYVVAKGFKRNKKIHGEAYSSLLPDRAWAKHCYDQSLLLDNDDPVKETMQMSMEDLMAREMKYDMEMDANGGVGWRENRREEFMNGITDPKKIPSVDHQRRQNPCPPYRRMKAPGEVYGSLPTQYCMLTSSSKHICGKDECLVQDDLDYQLFEDDGKSGMLFDEFAPLRPMDKGVAERPPPPKGILVNPKNDTERALVAFAWRTAVYIEEAFELAYAKEIELRGLRALSCEDFVTKYFYARNPFKLELGNSHIKAHYRMLAAEKLVKTLEEAEEGTTVYAYTTKWMLDKYSVKQEEAGWIPPTLDVGWNPAFDAIFNDEHFDYYEKFEQEFSNEFGLLDLNDEARARLDEREQHYPHARDIASPTPPPLVNIDSEIGGKKKTEENVEEDGLPLVPDDPTDVDVEGWEEVGIAALAMSQRANMEEATVGREWMADQPQRAPVNRRTAAPRKTAAPKREPAAPKATGGRKKGVSN